MAMIKASVKNNPASNNKLIPGKATILPLPQPGRSAKKVAPQEKPSSKSTQ